jgi:hypothetical protein
MQSVPITTNVVSSNPAQLRCTWYPIDLQPIKSKIWKVKQFSCKIKLWEEKNGWQLQHGLSSITAILTNQIVPFINCSISLYSGLHDQLEYWVYGLVFNATFNYFSAISRGSVLLVDETGVFGENDRPVASHWQPLSHTVVSNRVHLAMKGV